jgi:hypothetical protein
MEKAILFGYGFFIGWWARGKRASALDTFMELIEAEKTAGKGSPTRA